MGLGQIAFSPKTVAAYTDITRRLMMQSSMDAEGMLRRDLAIALSQTIDYAGYYGTGSDKMPRGLKNYTGINAVDFADTSSGAWATPTFAQLVQMETEVAADNADYGQMGYVGHTRFRGHCKTALKFSSAGSDTLWEPGGTVNGLHHCHVGRPGPDGGPGGAGEVGRPAPHRLPRRGHEPASCRVDLLG